MAAGATFMQFVKAIYKLHKALCVADINQGIVCQFQNNVGGVPYFSQQPANFKRQ